MAKSSTYLLRLDPQKKARRMLLAKEMGVSLAEWIEMASEAFESKNTLPRPICTRDDEDWGDDNEPIPFDYKVPGRTVPLQTPFERKPVGKIAKMLKEKG